MQETTNYKLKKPEGTDPVNVADFNENADLIDLELSKRVESAGGDISDTKIGAADTAAQEFPVPAPGDTARGFLGKMRKFCSDFNSFKTGVITLGKLVNNGLTTEEGYALDARYGKTLLDMVTRLNSDLGEVNSNFDIGKIGKNIIYLSASTDFDNISQHYVLANGPHSPGSGYWYVETLAYETNSNGTVKTGKQIAQQYQGDKMAVRHCLNGAAWSAWELFVKNTDFETVRVRVTTIANEAVAVSDAPKANNYIPVIVGHTNNNFCQETVFFDVDKWYIYSTVAQVTAVEFRKYLL